MKIKKSIFDLILAALNGVFKQYPALVMDVAKIEGLKYYIKGVLAARECLIFGVQLACTLILIMTAILLLHAGVLLVLFLVMQWSLATKLAIVFLMGILELAASFVFIWRLFSDKKWMKVSKADLLTASLLK